MTLPGGVLDFDPVVLGTPIAIRGLHRANANVVEEVVLANCLDQLDMTREQFVDFCLVLGNRRDNAYRHDDVDDATFRDQVY